MTENNKKVVIARAITRQTLIFLGYFGFCSLFLFNHKGGADIAFMSLIGISILLHLIILLSMVVKSIIKKDGKAPFIDLVIVLFWLTLFVLLSAKYLDFMWWLTNRI